MSRPTQDDQDNRPDDDQAVDVAKDEAEAGTKAEAGTTPEEAPAWHADADGTPAADADGPAQQDMDAPLDDDALDTRRHEARKAEDEKTIQTIVETELSADEAATVTVIDPDDEVHVDPEAEHDPFAATRESIDPDALRLQARPDAVLGENLRSDRLTPEEEMQAGKWRKVFHALAATASLVVLVAFVIHILGLGPAGRSTWTVLAASALTLAAAWVFPRARFQTKPITGSMVDRAKARERREFVMKAFGVGFGLAFVAITFLETMALLVAVDLVADLSGSSVILALHFVFVPGLILAMVLAGMYTRTTYPSNAREVPHQRWVEYVALALFAGGAIASAVFALGLPSVVTATEVEPRQAVYIATIATAAALVVANLRAGIPDVLQIIDVEVERSKEVDRRSAESMQKKMLRNYVLALLFVVGSIGFLVGKAAGFVDTESSGNLDLVLIIYLVVGILFMGIVLVNYFQAQQISKRVILPKKGRNAYGKRRYRPDEVTRLAILGASGTVAGLLLLMMLLVATGVIQSFGPVPIDRWATTDLFVFAVLAGMAPYGFYYAHERRRIMEIDEKFPDFLRDLAESQRAGMTLPSALVTASKGVYGPLTKEIKIMAAQVEWGVSFDEALLRFAHRTRTPLIERTVSLVREASASGGNVVDILSAASDDAREIKNILFERKQQMGVYSLIVYIAFGVFLTVISVLNSQFIPELAKSSSAAAGATVGGIQFGDIDVPAYQKLFFHAAIIQGIGGGLVSGVMTEGSPLSGLRHGAVMTGVAYLVFRFVIL